MRRMVFSRIQRWFWVFLAIAMLAATGGRVQAFGPEDPDEPPAAPSPAFDPSKPGYIDPRLMQPALPAQPTLADRGAQTWWGVCMACHGDAGQGLTDEWRQTAFGEDMNCWSAKCHGPRHPEYGFVFPRIVPPAWGSGALTRFVTASELQAYLLAAMPWWDPGSLSSQQAWELTAFLLRRSGKLPTELELDIANAERIPVHLTIRDASHERVWALGFAGLLALAGLGTAALRRFGGQSLILAAPFADTAIKRKSRSRPSFFHHLHPPTIPLPQARWRYTLGAGGAAVFLSLVLLFTGVLEMFFYVPTPQAAAESVQMITFLVPYGALVRGLHFWAAQALVVIIVVHLLRVVLTGAFAPPRRFNYLLGLALLLIVLLLDFTGYVLRWDEGIRWALMVGANLLKTIPGVGDSLYVFVVGEAEPGAVTLTRFYAWHIFGLTLLAAIGIGWHIFRVRRDGGIAAGAQPEAGRIGRDELARREVLAMLVLGALLALIATVVRAPLAAPIQTAASSPEIDSRAPWFFLWIQQLLRYGDAFWLGVALPLGLFGLLSALPYLPPRLSAVDSGRWLPRRGRVAQAIVVGIVLLWLALTVMEMAR